MVVRRAIVDKHPWLVGDLLDAYAHANAKINRPAHGAARLSHRNRTPARRRAGQAARAAGAARHQGQPAHAGNLRAIFQRAKPDTARDAARRDLRAEHNGALNSNFKQPATPRHASSPADLRRRSAGFSRSADRRRHRRDPRGSGASARLRSRAADRRYRVASLVRRRREQPEGHRLVGRRRHHRQSHQHERHAARRGRKVFRP